ncbi:MAG: hypothetical protein LBM00_05095 [Deltaproteobacteria bacterium]|jgi:hypothetical protein|nr:hypothetical protein [Deltaproteobacteria bacterium]
MLRAFRFALLLCGILSLAACGGGGGGGVGENPAVTPPLAFSAKNGFNLGDENVTKDAPEVSTDATNIPAKTPIDETLAVEPGSLKIVDTSANTTLITFADGPGGVIKLYDNGYLVADKYLPDDANDPDSGFAKAVVAGGSARPGTYNNEVLDDDHSNNDKFTGTVTYTDQALVAFTGDQDDPDVFSLAHSTFGAWAVSLTATGFFNTVDGEVQHGPFYEVMFFPFAGGAETNKNVDPPTGTYSGPAMAMLYHWTGDGSVFNNAYLTGTAELEVTGSNTASRIALLFPEFGDITLSGKTFNLSNEITGHGDGFISYTSNNGSASLDNIKTLDRYTLNAAFYTKDSVTEGVGTFHIRGDKTEDPLTGETYGVQLRGAFGVKKP